jgi:DNA replication protein DnaC
MDAKAMMEAFVGMVGVDCPCETDGDYRTDNGLLMCGVCNEPKESKHDVPLLGERVLPTMCRCERDKQVALEAEQKRQKQQDKVKEMFRYSIVNDRFRESTFNKFVETVDNKRNLKIAKRYVELFEEMYSRNKGLLFYGDPSTGKTFLASCIANALMEKGVPLIVTSILKLTSAFSPFSQSTEEQEEVIRKMSYAKLLILDDLGTERATDYKAEQVFDVIDSRYNSKKPMIITTNFSLSQMQNEPEIRRRRIFERIFEVCHPVPFIGKSWREKAAADDFDEIQKLLTE